MQRLCYFLSAVLLLILITGTIICLYWVERLPIHFTQQPPSAFSDKATK